MVRRRGSDPTPALLRAARRAGVTDERILAAMRKVDRRLFVPARAARQADRDAPVAIGAGQTTSQPSLIALMIQGLDAGEEDRVLEIGGGFGYQTALLSELAREVWSLEREPALAQAAEANLAAHGSENAHVVVGDGTKGLPDQAPFDGIIVSAASPGLPPAWAEQLVDGGRLVVPLGGDAFQEVVLFRKRGVRLDRERALVPVRFVPLREGE